MANECEDSFHEKLKRKEVAEQMIELGIQTRNPDGSFKSLEDIINQIWEVNNKMKDILNKRR